MAQIDLAECLSLPPLVVIGAVGLLLAVLPVGRTMAHLVHSRLGTRQNKCQRRTDTHDQLVFHLSQPQPVIFDFSRRDKHSFEVVIPAASRWSPVPTFHLQQGTCIRLFTLTGMSWVSFNSIVRGSGTTLATPGYTLTQTPRLFVDWGNHGQGTASSVLITAADTQVQLYRTLCSVAVDAERYFHLCATPLWIRALYAALGWVPAAYGGPARQALVRLALYVQLRVIFYKNDCWTYQGRVWIDWYWWTTPRWVWEFQGWTIEVISHMTLRFFYWLGRLCLGMREGYDEYTVGGEAFASASGQDMGKSRNMS